MTFQCEISVFFRQRNPVAKVLILSVVFSILLFAQLTRAATSIYVFDPNLSTVTKTGGFAGVNIAFSIEGRFQLSIEAGTAIFEKVDATLTDEAGSVYSQSLDEVFNMNGLVGDPAGDIIFKGKTSDGTESDVTIILTLEDGLARLTGGTTPPPNSADLFFYELDAVATRKYAAGTGELNDPYQIHTAEQMNSIGAEPSDWDSHFKLMADIDLSGFTGSDFNIIGYWLSWSRNKPFTGVFDGNGHAISNFSYSCPDTSYVGLFGYVDGQADQDTIKNLRLIDPNVDAETGNGVGSLVGWLRNGTVTACGVDGGIVSGSIAVGGLVGTHGPTSESPAPLPPPGPNPPPYTISECYSTAIVVGRVSIGGLVGSNSGLVTQCYSAGEVSGDIQVGGLVGDGIPVEVINSFWDTEASGLQTSAGGIGQTMAEMQTAGTFLEAGWDFADETVNGTEDIWWIEEGKDYPRLWWELRNYGGGSGEPNDPFLIYTAEQLNAIGAVPNDWDKHFKLMASIDLSGYIYDAALIAPDTDPCDPAFQGIPFKGSFDGDKHTISHLTIQGDGYLGLFGRLDAEAVVNRLKLADVNIVGSDYVGALVGFNYGHISMIYTTGTVSGNNRVGGLTGRNWGSIELSHNAASVTGNNDVGGIMAANYGSIINSYNTGEVTANMDAGGIVGENYGSITFTYSTGVISGNSRTGGLVGYNWQDSIVTSSFWDVEASGLTVSDGGIGKTTAEMQTKKTFTDAGWDFSREIVNGTEDIWRIRDGQDYPSLWWESIPVLN